MSDNQHISTSEREEPRKLKGLYKGIDVSVKSLNVVIIACVLVIHILVGIEPYKIPLLKRLAENYDVYMLSNNNPICTPRAELMFEEAGFSMTKDFKKCYISYQLKALKPSAECFHAIMDDIGIPAENMLFIDDSQKNVDGSIAAGLPAVYYEPGSDLAALLAEALNDPSLNS